MVVTLLEIVLSFVEVELDESATAVVKLDIVKSCSDVEFSVFDVVVYVVVIDIVVPSFSDPSVMLHY